MISVQMDVRFHESRERVQESLEATDVLEAIRRTTVAVMEGYGFKPSGDFTLNVSVRRDRL